MRQWVAKRWNLALINLSLTRLKRRFKKKKKKEDKKSIYIYIYIDIYICLSRDSAASLSSD